MSSIPTPYGSIGPMSRGKSIGFPFGAAGLHRLPTDPIGQAVVTLSGAVAGSEIRVYDPDLNELAGIETCATDQVLSWNVYAYGSPYNTVRIKIINTVYKIKDFLYTAQLGNQNIPVQMEADPWFSNP